MKRRLGALLPLALGLVWMVYALMSFPFGRLNQPGPALWPTFVAGFLVVASLALLLTERDDEDYEPFTERWRVVALGAASIASFIVLMELVGFPLAAVLVLVFWCRFLGKESWRLSVTVGVAGTATFFVVFGLLLGVPLPTIGILM